MEPRPVPLSPKSAPTVAAFHAGLLALVAPRLKTAVRQRAFGEVLAFVSRLKRSVSTIRAARNTLGVILERYQEMLQTAEEEQETRHERRRSLNDYRRRLQRYGALSAEEEADHALLEAEDVAAELRRGGSEDLEGAIQAAVARVTNEARRGKAKLKGQDAIARGLEGLIQIAEQAESLDPKLSQLVEEVNRLRATEPSANVLVYTEYTDSQLVAVEALRAAIAAGRLGGAVLSIQGEDSEKDRMLVTDRFQAEDGLILVSTDATAEGLNLHQRCHHLIHLELPYNTNRLEQRNGRIDRYGQTHDPRVTDLYLEGTFEERILRRLVAKYERQRARLTFVPNTLGVSLRAGEVASERLLEGLAEEDLSLFRR